MLPPPRRGGGAATHRRQAGACPSPRHLNQQLPVAGRPGPTHPLREHRPKGTCPLLRVAPPPHTHAAGLPPRPRHLNQQLSSAARPEPAHPRAQQLHPLGSCPDGGRGASPGRRPPIPPALESAIIHGSPTWACPSPPTPHRPAGPLHPPPSSRLPPPHGRGALGSHPSANSTTCAPPPGPGPPIPLAPGLIKCLRRLTWACSSPHTQLCPACAHPPGAPLPPTDHSIFCPASPRALASAISPAE